MWLAKRGELLGQSLAVALVDRTGETRALRCGTVVERYGQPYFEHERGSFALSDDLLFKSGPLAPEIRGRYKGAAFILALSLEDLGIEELAALDATGLG